MHLMCSPLESKEKAHADNCGFIACSPTCGHFPTLLLFPDNGKPGGHINSPAGLVPRNALVLIEFDADLPDGLATRPCWRFNAQLSEESHRFFAEHLLNNRPQMRAPSATRKVATLTKQMKIGLCEQVRVNWKTALSTLEETSPLRCYFIVGFKYFGLIPAPNLSARLPASVDERSVPAQDRGSATRGCAAVDAVLCGHRVILQVLWPPRHNGAILAHSLCIRLCFVVGRGQTSGWGMALIRPMYDMPQYIKSPS